MLGYLALLFLLCSCTNRGERRAVFGRTMGTSYNIKYIPPQRFSLSHKHVENKIDSLLTSINREMSTYDPESVISRFNALRTTEHWYPIPKGFFTVLTQALQLANFTEGAFDPTLGPLINLWGFGPRGKKQVPDEKEIARTRSFTGYKKIEINEKKKAIRKKHPRLYLDLSAIAKGWAVDEVGRLLESLGLQEYMVEIGGEVKFKGLRSWRIGVVQPRKRSTITKILQFKTGGAFATSGNYHNNFTKEGKTYAHIIDNKTGRAVHYSLMSITIFRADGNCMRADALATALMAMGLSKAKSFAEKHALAAYFVYKDQNDRLREFTTPLLDRIIKENL